MLCEQNFDSNHASSFCPKYKCNSRNQIVDDCAMHIGQAMVAVAVAEGQAFVVDAH